MDITILYNTVGGFILIMAEQTIIKQIDKRYTDLAEKSCCLSCGSAINYAEAKPGEVCVDLGSGRGTDILKLAQAVGPEGFAYGFDISSGMIEKAEHLKVKLGIDNAKFIRTELENLPLESNSTDLIISNCTLNHVADKLKIWKEIQRILKPGGRFVVSDIYSTEEVPEIYANDPLAVSECWAGAVTKDIYIDTLLNAGLINLKIYEESIPYKKGKIEVASFTISGMKGDLNENFN